MLELLSGALDLGLEHGQLRNLGADEFLPRAEILAIVEKLQYLTEAETGVLPHANHSDPIHCLGWVAALAGLTANPQLVRTDRGPFGLPRGLPGRLAGRLMASNDDQHRELAALVALRNEARCEVGFGPGVLLGLLRARFPDAELSGVESSTVMLDQASRANANGEWTLRLGAVGELPFEEDSFDVTVSVNTVQFWPDLVAGLREIARVTRPGGKVLVAGHGGSSPSRIQRRLILDDSELTRIASAVNEHVGDGERVRLIQSELFTAEVPVAPRAR